MDDRAPWQTLLREALTMLALPADEQVRANSPGCVACDLVNDFDHARIMAFGEAKLSDDQRQTLEAIDSVMRAMEEPDFECFNNEVLRRPVWKQLRELAADALRLFGWERIVIEPFVEVEPGVWRRAPSAARPDGTRDPGGLSPSKPSDLNVNEVIKSRVPRWVILGGCLSVFVCLVLCGIAVGVWVYILKNGYVFKKTPDSTAPSFTPSPDMGNFGPPIEGVVVNGRLVEAQGGFSYVPPEGWMAYNLPGLLSPALVKTLLCRHGYPRFLEESV